MDNEEIKPIFDEEDSKKSDNPCNYPWTYFLPLGLSSGNFFSRTALCVRNRSSIRPFRRL